VLPPPSYDRSASGSFERDALSAAFGVVGAKITLAGSMPSRMELGTGPSLLGLLMVTRIAPQSERSYLDDLPEDARFL
jgi:hypothetical protein